MEESEIVDTCILIEGKGKMTTIFNVIEYPKSLEMKIEILWPTKEDYYKAIEMMLKLLKAGKPMPAIDIIIASMCINRGLRFLTKDKHFDFIKKIEPKFSVQIMK